MPTLHVEHQISDYERWKQAFDRDPVDRAGSGVRAHRIQRPLDDPSYIVVDLDFDSAEAAQRFQSSLERLWASGEAAPVLVGDGKARIVETVETQSY